MRPRALLFFATLASTTAVQAQPEADLLRLNSKTVSVSEVVSIQQAIAIRPRTSLLVGKVVHGGL